MPGRTSLNRDGRPFLLVCIVLDHEDSAMIPFVAEIEYSWSEKR